MRQTGRQVRIVVLLALLLGGTAVGARAAPGSKAARTPRVGSSITLRSDDEFLRVTLLAVRDPAYVLGAFGSPAPRNKLVSVLLKVANLGRDFYHDSPGNGTKLISASTRVYSTVLPGIDPNLDGLAGLSRGASEVGWLTFEVPAGMRPWKLRYVLDSGFADQRGEWLLR
jgi:hypothetical protein